MVRERRSALQAYGANTIMSTYVGNISMSTYVDTTDMSPYVDTLSPTPPHRRALRRRSVRTNLDVETAKVVVSRQDRDAAYKAVLDG